MLRSLLTKPRREGDELLAQLQQRQEEKELHLTQSSDTFFFLQLDFSAPPSTYLSAALIA